jgi:hypothetical protein
MAQGEEPFGRDASEVPEGGVTDLACAGDTGDFGREALHVSHTDIMGAPFSRILR